MYNLVQFPFKRRFLMHKYLIKILNTNCTIMLKSIKIVIMRKSIGKI
jgi:hypothetical protein